MIQSFAKNSIFNFLRQKWTFIDFNQMIDQSQDKTLSEWIQRDLAENLALAEYCDIEDVLDAQPKRFTQLLPKYRLVSDKKIRKPKKKTAFYIEDSKSEELTRMLKAKELVKQEIQQEEITINKITIKNAEAKRKLAKSQQNLKKIQMSVEDQELENAKKIEEERLAQEKLQKEENRSRKARSQIAQKTQEAKEELKALIDAHTQMKSDYNELKKKRERKRQNYQKDIKELKAENEQLQTKVLVIEHQL